MRMSYSIIVKTVAYNKLEAAVTLFFFFSFMKCHIFKFRLPYTILPVSIHLYTNRHLLKMYRNQISLLYRKVIGEMAKPNLTQNITLYGCKIYGKKFGRAQEKGTI